MSPFRLSDEDLRISRQSTAKATRRPRSSNGDVISAAFMPSSRLLSNSLASHHRPFKAPRPISPVGKPDDSISSAKPAVHMSTFVTCSELVSTADMSDIANSHRKKRQLIAQQNVVSDQPHTDANPDSQNHTINKHAPSLTSKGSSRKKNKVDVSQRLLTSFFKH